MIRGDVCWHTFRLPDKRRPVLVLTREDIRQHLDQVTVAPITTRVRGTASEVFLGPEDGMPEECAVNLLHLQTVPKQSLGRVIAHLGPARLAEARAALLFALGFD